MSSSSSNNTSTTTPASPTSNGSGNPNLNKMSDYTFNADDDELGVDVFGHGACTPVPLSPPSKNINDAILCGKIRSPTNNIQKVAIRSGVDDFTDVNLYDDNKHSDDFFKAGNRLRYNFVRPGCDQLWQKYLPQDLRRRRLAKFLLFGSMAVLLVALISVPVTSRQNKKGDNNKETQTSINQPSFKANATDKCLHKKNGDGSIGGPSKHVPVPLTDLLSIITPLEVLLDPCAVQYEAVLWLLYEQQQVEAALQGISSPAFYMDEMRDFFHTDLNDASVLQEGAPLANLLLQRYAVLVMNLALNADFAKVGVPTCLWPGVRCVEPQPGEMPHVAVNSAVQAILWNDQNLQGTLPNEIRALSSHLMQLDLAENQISGPLPDGLFDCTKLQYLYLHKNQFSSTLSEKFSNLRHLLSLYLGQNQFTGQLPAGLGSEQDGSARPLRYLSVHKNQLTGPIPKNTNWRFMFWLDLSYNQLTGPLPLDWSEGQKTMVRLRHLFVNNNRLSGSIPDSYPSMGNGRVEMFHAGHNQLTGTVPGNYTPVNFIQSLEVHGNNLTALDPLVCGLIIFVPPASELANLKVDCNICTCEWWCDPGYCYDASLV